jgi:hypothetical protein
LSRSTRLPLLLANALLFLGSGCGPSNVVLRSNHYKFVVPLDWQVEGSSSEEDQPTVLRVPAAATDKSGEKLELRVYGWVAPETSAPPIDFVVARLAGHDESSMRSAAARDESLCGDPRRPHALLGDQQGTAHLKARSGQHLIVTAGTASGSLVGVVGVIPDRQPFCDNVSAMDAAISSLQAGLAKSGDITRFRSSPVMLSSPSGRGPVVEIPGVDPGPP